MRLNENNKKIKKGEYILRARSGNVKIQVLKNFEYKKPGDLLKIKILEGVEQGTEKEIDIKQVLITKIDGNTKFC